MKVLKLSYLIMALTVCLMSCKKESNNTSTGVFSTSNKTISAKWNIAESGNYKSFEFNESGNYIITKTTTTKSSTDSLIVLFGTYQIIDSTTIKLSDFGTIAILSINSNSFKFKVKLNSSPNTEVTLNSTKAATTITNTSKTDLLCKTWQMITVNGENAKGTEMDLTVLFSNAGTYFVSYAKPDFESDGRVAQWTWKDSKETSFCYSWDGAPTCDESNEVTVEITSNQLTIVENEETYVLKPAAATKSATFKSVKCLNTIKQGFFRK
jgi:hypothetical protein